MLRCLAIECTAHTFGIGIVDEKGNVLADVRDMYTTASGGIIPSDAAKHHRAVRDQILEKALAEAKLSLDAVDVIAFSQGPGLAPSLLAGKEFVRDLAMKHKKPLVGVNHLLAHLEIGLLFCAAKDPVFVFVSGANTQIIAYEGGRYRVFGEALSVGLGNALDKFGRGIGLGFPAGPKIEELAKQGKYVELPYVVKGMDVEFSGIVTHALDLHKKGVSKEDLCFSLQETGFAMLAEVTERALAHTGKKEALLIGGVAANKRFNAMLRQMCAERGATYYECPMKWTGDNGINIAWTGIKMFMAGYKPLKSQEIDINPRWRLEDVEVFWK